MSIYGPKISLPKISLPGMPDMSGLGGKTPIILGIIAIVLIVLLLLAFGPGIAKSFNPAIIVSWKENPLDLKSDVAKNAELNLVLVNTTEKMTDINLTVTTESNEILVICPYLNFQNVEPSNNRQVTCIIRRNPNSTIFAGNYTLTITTNLGSTKTVLEVRTK